MRSIRLSLTIYFLVLLAVALGTVSVLAYHASQQTLEEKKNAAKQLLEEKQNAMQEVAEAKFREDSREITRQLDRSLLEQARRIAQMTQFQKDEKKHREFQTLFEDWRKKWEASTMHQRAAQFAGGMLSAALKQTPGSLAEFGWWGNEASKPYLGVWFPWLAYNNFMANNKSQIRLQPSAPPLLPIEEGVQEYFQVNSPWGDELRSPSLKSHKFSVDPSVFDPAAPAFDLDWDDVQFGQAKLRRVTFLTPIPRLLGSSVVPTPGVPTRQSRGRMPPRPTIFVQYACDTSHRDAAIAALAQKRDEAIALLGEKRDEAGARQ